MIKPVGGYSTKLREIYLEKADKLETQAVNETNLAIHGKLRGCTGKLLAMENMQRRAWSGTLDARFRIGAKGSHIALLRLSLAAFLPHG